MQWDPVRSVLLNQGGGQQMLLNYEHMQTDWSESFNRRRKINRTKEMLCSSGHRRVETWDDSWTNSVTPWWGAGMVAPSTSCWVSGLSDHWGLVCRYFQQTGGISVAVSSSVVQFECKSNYLHLLQTWTSGEMCVESLQSFQPASFHAERILFSGYFGLKRRSCSRYRFLFDPH